MTSFTLFGNRWMKTSEICWSDESAVRFRMAGKPKRLFCNNYIAAKLVRKWNGPLMRNEFYSSS